MAYERGVSTAGMTRFVSSSVQDGSKARSIAIHDLASYIALTMTGSTTSLQVASKCLHVGTILWSFPIGLNFLHSQYILGITSIDQERRRPLRSGQNL